MPIYEYQCTACARKLDAFQKISDAPLTDCPSCGEPQLKKCVTAPAFQLKGAGWYETDFKDKKKPAGNKEADKEKKDGKETAKTDTKKPESATGASASSGSKNSDSSS
ncbi:MAG: zinc ribbon domain-containing protein [Thiotrichales bacterium]|nr:zinc ribbon domain-containing protein [Thiotrichales bacterium]